MLHKNVVGMISDKDIMRAVYQGKEPGGTFAKDITTNIIIMAESESTVYSFIKVMLENEVTRIPVCREKQILGIVCQSDIIKKAIGPGIMCI